MFSHIDSEIQAKRYNNALDLLSLYLEYEFDDVRGLEALATVHHLQKNYPAAVDALYQAKSYSHQQNKIDELTRQIHRLASQYASLLKKNRDQLALMEFYQQLVSREPDNPGYYIGLAEAYLALGNGERAKDTLQMIAFAPQVNNQVNLLMDRIENRAPIRLDNSSPVSLIPAGDHYLVHMQINGGEMLTLMLDTGASITAINARAADRLGLDVQGARKYGWFNTAGGVVRAPILTVHSLSAAGQAIQNLEMAIMDIQSSKPIDGLLGMNYLKHFEFYIDQNANIMHLIPKVQ
jgi:clan AA aspartic protease (TIGR02281 family)